jgi:excisionase family DNA binding protein
MLDVQPRKPLRNADYPATLLGVENWKIYDLCRRGILPHVKIGRLYRFDEDKLEHWIESGGSGLEGDNEPGDKK